MKQLNLEDIIQVCIGSIILALPIAFTEEAWKMSTSLPAFKVILIFITSILLDACFIFYGVYEANIKDKYIKFSSRIIVNYAITFITVSYILWLLDIYNTHTSAYDMLAKTIIVSFPASLSGAIVDSFDKE